MTSLLQKSSFWLFIVALCHLLLLLSFTLHWQPVIIALPEKRPFLEIPSYVYREQAQPRIQESQPQQSPEKDKLALQKIQRAVSTQVQNQQNTVSLSSSKSQTPVHMIGDKKVDNKLMKALGRALSAHLIYPKIAVDFKIKGTALVGMTLNPDGRITDVELVESSRADVLDNAALAAVIGASPMISLSTYLTKPKHIVVGIMFR